jgi:hypothetical protein
MSEYVYRIPDVTNLRITPHPHGLSIACHGHVASYREMSVLRTRANWKHLSYDIDALWLARLVDVWKLIRL